jgi:hypothetical protein
MPVQHGAGKTADHLGVAVGSLLAVRCFAGRQQQDQDRQLAQLPPATSATLMYHPRHIVVLLLGMASA